MCWGVFIWPTTYWVDNTVRCGFLTRAVTYSVVFGIGYGLGLGLLFAWLPVSHRYHPGD